MPRHTHAWLFESPQSWTSTPVSKAFAAPPRGKPAVLPRSSRAVPDPWSNEFLPPCSGQPDPGNVGDAVIVSTSVHTLETNGGLVQELHTKPLRDPLTHDDDGDYNAPTYVSTCFRHSGWHRERSKVYDALQRTEAPVARRIAFARCGSTYHVLRSKEDPTEHRLAAKACHDRFCKVCGGERSRLIARNVREFLKGQACRFITLTLRNDGQSLQTQLDRLYKGFQALRKSTCWKATQRGGVAFLEVKRSSKSGLWHPHLHVIAQGKYLDQAKLSTTWKVITGDSHIVDIRPVKDVESAVAYVAKYASKPMDPSSIDTNEHLDECMRAMKGRRTITTFGKWRGLRVTSKPDKDKWENTGTLDEYADRAVNGDTAAEQIVRSLTGDWAERWLTASRRRAGHRPRPDDADLNALSFVDLDPIPF